MIIIYSAHTLCSALDIILIINMQGGYYSPLFEVYETKDHADWVYLSKTLQKVLKSRGIQENLHFIKQTVCYCATSGLVFIQGKAATAYTRIHRAASGFAQHQRSKAGPRRHKTVPAYEKATTMTNSGEKEFSSWGSESQ